MLRLVANEEMVRGLFCFVYNSMLGKAGDETENRKVERGETLKLTEEFAAQVPKLEFSPAEIVSVLLANKQSPRLAIENIDAWLEKFREEWKKFKRADSWVLNGAP